MDFSVTLDQLRVFSTIVDTGSFSAAARRLNRTQGAVSYNVATLEGLLDVSLFNRAGRRPALTDEGRTLLTEARAILERVTKLDATARGLSDGLEASLSIAIDTLYPAARLAEVITTIGREFPTVPLDVRTGILTMVTDRVDNGDCDLGIAGASGLSDAFVIGACASVELIAVVAPSHPLAAAKHAVDDSELREHVNIVLSDHTESTQGVSTSVGGSAWRINDSEVRRQLLRAGLGWARMPRHQIAEDLERGALVKLRTKRWKRKNTVVELRTIYRRDRPPGRAGRAFLELAAAR